MKDGGSPGRSSCFFSGESPSSRSLLRNRRERTCRTSDCRGAYGVGISKKRSGKANEIRISHGDPKKQTPDAIRPTLTRYGAPTEIMGCEGGRAGTPI